MSVLPSTKVGRIEFCEQRLSPWSSQAVNIGTTAAAVTDLQTKTTAARAKFLAREAAYNAAKAATIDFDLAVRAMTDAAADILKQVRAKAATAGNSVYALAEIPAPATPSPKPPPGTPTDFVVTLGADGALHLKWKCANPPGATGTIYQVWRRIGSGGGGEFGYLGGTGTKSIVDATVPAGSAGVTYQIQAVRSTVTGPWAQFNVNFGVGSGGTMTASVVQVPPSGGAGAPKMAA